VSGRKCFADANRQDCPRRKRHRIWYTGFDLRSRQRNVLNRHGWGLNRQGCGRWLRRCNGNRRGRWCSGRCWSGRWLNRFSTRRRGRRIVSCDHYLFLTRCWRRHRRGLFADWDPDMDRRRDPRRGCNLLRLFNLSRRRLKRRRWWRVNRLGSLLPGHFLSRRIGRLDGKIHDSRRQHGTGPKSRRQFPIQVHARPPCLLIKRKRRHLRFGVGAVKIA